MKLIKQGQLPEDKIREIECRHCKSEYEITKKDCERVQDWRDGDFYWFICPTCKTKRAIDAYLMD